MMGQEITGGEGKLIAILKELNNASMPVGSSRIARRLEREGVFLSARGVRYHLKNADARGYTRPYGRGGRMITNEGREEIQKAMAERRIGSVLNKLKMLAFQTTFDVEKRAGLVPIDISLINKGSFQKAISAMKEAFNAGLCVSDLTFIALEGEKIASINIPPGKIGVATVSCTAINGVLLKAGIPTDYKYGGILELVDGQPKRFTSIIDYAGTSFEPAEEFIRSGMTSVAEAASTGDGKVLGIFRTIPAAAGEIAEEKIKLLGKARIGGVCAIGSPNELLCRIMPEVNRIGIIQLDGLNPAAAAVEAGAAIENYAGGGMIDYRQLKPVGEWKIKNIDIEPKMRYGKE
jgi:repressor of nif and glnA expression